VDAPLIAVCSSVDLVIEAQELGKLPKVLGTLVKTERLVRLGEVALVLDNLGEEHALLDAVLQITLKILFC
jgi:hypothetical protein